jgi:hypothetical protein
MSNPKPWRFRIMNLYCLSKWIPSPWVGWVKCLLHSLSPCLLVFPCILHPNTLLCHLEPPFFLGVLFLTDILAGSWRWTHHFPPSLSLSQPSLLSPPLSPLSYLSPISLSPLFLSPLPPFLSTLFLPSLTLSPLSLPPPSPLSRFRSEAAVRGWCDGRQRPDQEDEEEPEER